MFFAPRCLLRPIRRHRRVVASLLTAFGAAAVLGSCGDGPVDPDHAAVTRVVVAPSPIALGEGEVLVLQATAYDRDDRPLYFAPPPTWVVADTTLAVVGAGGRLRALRPGTTTVTATVGRITGSASVDIRGRPVGVLTLTPSTVDALTGDTVRLHAVARDTAGAVITTPAITWTSADTTIATIDSTGLVRVHRAGTTTVRAAAGAVAGYATLTAGWAPLDAIRLTPTILSLTAGDTAAIQAEPTDAAGNPVPADLTWASADTSVATVSDAGVIRARRPGTTAITVRAGSIESQLPVTVTEPKDAVLAGVSPDPFLPGDTITLSGAHFADTPERHVLTIDGVPATITAATPTTLRAVVPAVVDGCRATAPVPVALRILRGALEDTVTITGRFATARQVLLEPGELAELSGHAQAGCLELVNAAGRHLVTVANTTTGGTATMTVGIVGSGSASVRARASTLEASAAHVTALPAPQQRQSLVPPDVRARAAAHAARLAANEGLVLRHRRASSPSLLRTRPAPLPAVGGTLAVKVPALSDICNVATTITARVLYAGPRVVLLEDVVNPLAGQMDTTYQRLAQEFEAADLPLLEAAFGSPFAYAAALDADERLTMVFTTQVNAMSGGTLAGFVASSDFYPTSTCPASNRNEIFYAMVPQTSSAIAGWRARMPGTMVHEVKHLISNAERFAYAARAGTAVQTELRWLEEATAMIAEELWARAENGAVQRGETAYDPAVRCELYRTMPGYAACAGRHQVMVDHYYWLAEYLAANGSRSPLASTGSGDNSYYGSGWALVRWALDASLRSETAILRGLTQEGSRTGVTNLAHHADIYPSRLLSRFNVAMHIDGQSPVGDAARSAQFPSWRLRDIYAGLHADLPGTFPTPYPAEPTVIPVGAFVTTATIRGGSATTFELQGTSSAGQLLQFTGRDGASLPGSVTVTIARLP